MNVRRTVVAALAWLAVVAVGSTVVWAVISRAGGGIAPTADPGMVTTSTTTGPVVPEPSARRPSDSSSRPPSRSPSRTPDGSPSGSPDGSPGGSPDGSPHGGATGPAAPPAPTAQRRTWQGPGGLVIAECRGAAISVVSYSADPGFRVEVGDGGPEHLEVHFEGQGEEGRETELKAECAAGVPEFDVDSRDD